MKTIDKIMILMLSSVMVACIAQSDTIATEGQGLICDPDCDPGGQQFLIDAVGQAGGGLGTQDPGSMVCRTFPASSECSAMYRDPWTQRYLVDCAHTSQYGTICDTVPCGYAGQIDCPR